MNPERTLAYRRVIKTLNEVGPSKLLHGEQERIRYAADNLLFSCNLDEDVAALALDDVERLCRALIESGRWEKVSADRLANDLCACGPAHPAALRAA